MGGNSSAGKDYRAGTQELTPLAKEELIVIYLFFLFFIATGLSVLLRYTDSDYHFGIFKLSCVRLISTFLLLSLGRYLCWRTIIPRGYHPPSSQCFGTDMVYYMYFYWNLHFTNNAIIIKTKLLLSDIGNNYLAWAILSRPVSFIPSKHF